MDITRVVAAQAPLIIQVLWGAGHINRPFGEQQALPDAIPEPTPEDVFDGNFPPALANLSLQEPALVTALESYKHFMVNNLEPLIARHHPERRSAAPAIDGSIGPATLELLGQQRCAHPDYTEPVEMALGSGQWRSCHNIGNFHAAIIKVMNSPPSHMDRPYQNGTVWDEIKRRVRACYAEVGLRIYFSDDDDCPDGNHQTEMSFVGSGAGWIGLALIGQGQQCQSSPIWMRVVSTYLQSSSISEDYLTLWANLVIHEFGHNTGSQHTSGGIMNPGILRVPNRWIGDPAESRMKGWFGGEPVVIGQPDPPTPGTIFQIDEARLSIIGKKLLMFGDLK